MAIFSAGPCRMTSSTILPSPAGPDLPTQGTNVTTLLAIGDMHLGRPPAALPEDLLPQAAELGPERAWERAVDLALERKVDAVLLAGDLVDQSRDFFVAYGQLTAGIERLAQAGIRVLAVAGNHDTEILPRLAAQIGALELLGENGRWQHSRVDNLVILGWSFPQPQVRHSPLDSLPRTRHEGFTVGLLHGDRDQGNSVYAPLARADLEDAPVDAWLLGHIHRPDQLDVDRPIGYLGSISALRASETGPRGPWLIQIENRDLAADHIPLAPLRYDDLTLDCSALPTADDLPDLLLESVRKHVQQLARGDYLPTALGLRLRLTGHHRHAQQIGTLAEQLTEDRRSWNESGVACFIHKLESRLLPEIDLVQLASYGNPAGLLARHLLALEDPQSEECQRLLRLAHEAMTPVARRREFQGLQEEASLDDSTILAWLRRAAHQALNQLMTQRETQA